MDSQTPSPSSSSCSRSTDTVNAYSPHFETELRRRHVFFLRGRTEHNPIDIDDFKSSVSRERGSPEPTEEDVHRIRVKADKSRNEAAVVQSILPELLPLDELYTSDDIETIPNQQWDKRVTLPVPALPMHVADDDGSPSRKRKAPASTRTSTTSTTTTRLAVPKPDQAVGLSSESLTCYNARTHLGHVCTPVAADSDLLFPFFTAECKGDQGRLKVSRMQNAHNAAVMLHNMHRLRCAASGSESFSMSEPDDPFVDSQGYDSRVGVRGEQVDSEGDETYFEEGNDDEIVEKDDFYNCVHAVTLSLSTESIELCYHWASSSEPTAKRRKCVSTTGNSDDLYIYTKPLNTWSLSSESHTDYVMARRCVRNALDWCRDRTASWVRRNMDGLESRLCRKRQRDPESQPQLQSQPKKQKTARDVNGSSTDQKPCSSHEAARRNVKLSAGTSARTQTRRRAMTGIHNRLMKQQQQNSSPTLPSRSGSGLRPGWDMKPSDDDDDDIEQDASKGKPINNSTSRQNMTRTRPITPSADKDARSSSSSLSFTTAKEPQRQCCHFTSARAFQNVCIPRRADIAAGRSLSSLSSSSLSSFSLPLPSSSTSSSSSSTSSSSLCSSASFSSRSLPLSPAPIPSLSSSSSSS